MKKNNSKAVIQINPQIIEMKKNNSKAVIQTKTDTTADLIHQTKNKIHARCTIFSYASASLIPYCSRIIKRSSTEPSFA